MTKLQIEIPEFLFVIYFWSFAILRPLLQYFSNYSSQLLLISSTILLLIQIIHNKKKNVKQLDISTILFLFVLFLFYCDTILRGSEMSLKYLYEYIYRGIIPIVFLSKVRFPQKILLYYAYLSSLTFCIYIIDPINNYSIFGDYMTFGFSLAFPAFFGIFLGFHYLKIKWMILLEIVCFIEIIIFANRGALLSTIVFIFLYFILCVNYKTTIKKIILLLSLTLIIVGYLNINILIKDINEVTQKYNYQSYSMSKITSFIEGDDNDDQFSGRLEIWDNANKMISENPLIGSGTEAFLDKYNSYSHNIYLDILLYYGYFGFVFIAILCIYSIISILKSKSSIQILGILFFCLWCPKLFLSSYFFQETGFWCFLAFPLLAYKLQLFSMLNNQKSVKTKQPNI